MKKRIIDKFSVFYNFYFLIYIYKIESTLLVYLNIFKEWQLNIKFEI